MTTALRTEAAKALSDAAYAVRQENAGIAEVRAHVARAIAALEMSLPVTSAGQLVIGGRQ